ncbi:MAG: glycosyltransferase family 4 protein [Actinobacteria bacterium]|nr:glycosyltransferase family 4 protein [Actinomycetota bacterium]
MAHVVRSDSFAGVERYITYVAPGLARHGIDVVVIGGDDEPMSEALGPAGIRHHPAATTLETARRILQCRPLDLLHTHMVAAELAAMVTQPVTRTPFITTRHFAARRGSSPAGRLVAAPIARAVRREIAVSRFVADAIGRPSVLLPSGVPCRSLGTERGRVVVMAQRLEAEKGVAVGIQAWAASGLAASGWSLVVVGDGTLAGELRALAQRLGVRGSVEFVGRRASLDELFSAAGIFLAPTPAEAFGLSVVEAMAAGLPVVASAGGAHLETVGACSTAWLFPPGDAAACADRLRRLAADGSERTRYGAGLQAVQRRHFSLGDHVEGLASLYRELLAVR